MSDEAAHTDRQRRNFFRKEMSLPVSAKLFAVKGQTELPAERDMMVKTVNLSAGGILLLTTGKTPAADLVSEGALIDLSFASLGSPLPIRLLGRVVRVDKSSPDEVSLAVEFILITPSEADMIAQKVLL